MDPAPTRLYLISPPRIADARAFAALCADLFTAGDVACFRLALEEAPETEWIGALQALKPLCHARDVALVAAGRFDLVKPFGLDGVHIEGPEAIEEARAAIGKNAILGVGAGLSRHAGLLAAEMDADYISFSPAADPEAAELLRWWQEMIQAPVVAEGGLTPALAARLAGVVDFLAPRSSLWNAPDPLAQLKAYEAARKPG